jgi:hypothetical protein
MAYANLMYLRYTVLTVYERANKLNFRIVIIKKKFYEAKVQIIHGNVNESLAVAAVAEVIGGPDLGIVVM